MKIGFLAHPTTISEKNHVRAIDLLNKLIEEGESGYSRSTWSAQHQVPFAETATIRSARGSECSAVIHHFPLTAEEMMLDVTAAQKSIVKAVNNLANEGVDLVGLGGTTSIVGGRGTQTARDSLVPVTSGNSLTAYAAYEALVYVNKLLKNVPSSTRIAVIGYPGSIALAITRLLLEDGYSIDLVHSGRTAPSTLKKHLQEHSGIVSYFDSIEKVYSRNKIFVSATSVGGVIDENLLLPGSIVVDVALPRDVLRAAPRRNDILTIDGGFVNANSEVMIGASFSGVTVNRHINACLAETIILGLEGRDETFSIGRNLPIDKVREIGKIAETHGFTILPLASWEEVIIDSDIQKLEPYHRSTKSQNSRLGVKEETLNNYHKYCDPLTTNHKRFNFIDTVADNSNGAKIYEDKTPYLDLDAAQGAVTLGHNRPELIQTLQTFIEGDKASSTHHATLPYETSVLCRTISDTLVGSEYKISITTSAAEALQNAINIATVATRGKSILQVQSPVLRKLSPSVSLNNLATLDIVPPDLQAITDAVTSDIGSLIIEPFVDSSTEESFQESVKFFTQIRDFCRQMNLLLIVDESKTAFRTQSTLAANTLELEPDIICLGESLSGGMLPVGASCIRETLWHQASDILPGITTPNAQLAGYNLGSAVSLQALELYRQPDFLSQSALTAEIFHAGIIDLLKDFTFLSKSYGSGLYWQLQFSNPLTGAIEAALTDITARSPGALRRLLQEIPVQTGQMILTCSAEIEKTLEQIQFNRIVTKLNQDHQILIDVSRESDKTIIVTPPLTITEEEAQYTIDALREVLADMSTVLHLPHTH
ncbi:aminotransferase class III-fold pyridoxal phosphate-dependent enzyme [Rothia nasisuis]|uniref:aminotransferase class III-fold pyridoxal phosphate-dependent enzyme n=1 Tax=Rothia nasisuis TaxID=2109647 RepID=UPI001F01213F|nr:aminotransferase class III-fold pyridoxal phosphate-dependent enzyme [Rothia nasisuis]